MSADLEATSEVMSTKTGRLNAVRPFIPARDFWHLGPATHRRPGGTLAIHYGRAGNPQRVQNCWYHVKNNTQAPPSRWPMLPRMSVLEEDRFVSTRGYQGRVKARNVQYKIYPLLQIPGVWKGEKVIVDDRLFTHYTVCTAAAFLF